MARKSWLIATLLPVVAAGCSTHPGEWKSNSQKHVLATFAPVYCFAANVAGNDAEVHCLLAEKGPHDYEPTPADAIKVRGADLFLQVGLGLDEFVDKLVTSSANKKIEAVELGEDLPKEMLLNMAAEPAGHEGHHHGSTDPHVWLGPPQAIAMVDIIAEHLGKLDPAHKDAYAERAKKEVASLKELHEHGQAAFKDKKNKRIITMHESLQYFAAAFGLEIEGSIQPQPGTEADAQKIAELARICKEKGIGIICTEPQYDKKSATLRLALKNQGLDVKLVEIDPIETGPPSMTPAYYKEVMRKNIDALAEAMQ